MRNVKLFNLILTLLVGLVLTVPSIAQDQDKNKAQASNSQSTPATPEKQPQVRIESGKKQKIEGVVIRRDVENLIIRDRSGAEITVNLTGTTKIEERKSNPFRGGRKYDTSSLVRGLPVEIEGRGNDSGALVAEKIRIYEDDFRVAQGIESRVDPVEGRVTSTENRLTQAEQNAQRLSGQLEELAAVANTAKGGAKAAQESADAAMSEAKTANQRVTATNERVAAMDDRISNMDDYEARSTITINFKVNSAVLSADAKTTLDEIANQAKNEKGYVLQVAGFASSDGNEAHNRVLSERRANAVVRYLMENHDIPQRRIITPFGYGELKPVAENNTRDGRQQNRRVEVAILVSKGLTSPVAATKSTDKTTTEATRQRTSNVPQQ